LMWTRVRRGMTQAEQKLSRAAFPDRRGRRTRDAAAATGASRGSGCLAATEPSAG
jgi:hypothetical protein